MSMKDMDVQKEVETITERGRHPYFRFLKTTFDLETVDSRTDTPEAQHLQTLLNLGKPIDYEKEKAKYEQSGHKFRLTDMVLYESFPTKRTIKVRVAIQVKEHTITWYFWVPGGKDQYSQIFRDILYKSAAEAHQQTTRGCDLYYRGSNAFHVKTMHTIEDEAGHNHNHYRMKDNKPVRPEDFTEHMLAMKNTEAFRSGFFEMGEIEEIIEDFNTHYRMWTYKGMNGNDPSPEEIYMDLPQNKINAEDVLEFKMFGEQQEPCRINVTELSMDFDHARKVIAERFIPKEEGMLISEESTQAMKLEIARLSEQFNALMSFRKIGGSRGIGSERAMTRQVEGSHTPQIPVVAAKDDSIGGPPVIPAWAKHALEQVEIARHSIEEMVQKQHKTERALIPYQLFNRTLTFIQLYNKVHQALKVQVDQIIMDNASSIRLGDFKATLRDLRKLLLLYHPDKPDHQLQPGFYELQKIIERLRSPNKAENQAELLVILDKSADDKSQMNSPGIP